MASDIELLSLEIETLWTRDGRGRLLDERRPGGNPAPLIVLAGNGVDRVTAFGSDVPERLVEEVLAGIDVEASWPEPPSPPGAMARCEEVLREAMGPLALSGGPSFVFAEGLSVPTTTPVICSDDATAASFHQLRPVEGWGRDEWRSLLSGALGPWAAAALGGRVVSLCHCARLTERGAEAGVWTDKAHRRLGYAASVSAAWASLLADTGRVLFYSTSAENKSSQRVAARLELQPIGWMWKVERSAWE
jgi:hypothetical protein